MYSLMGLEVAREIHHDRLAAAEQRRAAHAVRTTLFERVSRRVRKVPAPVLQVGRARATAPSAPMGCTA